MEENGYGSVCHAIVDTAAGTLITEVALPMPENDCHFKWPMPKYAGDDVPIMRVS